MRCFFIFQYHFRKNIVSFFRSGHPVFCFDIQNGSTRTDRRRKDCRTNDRRWRHTAIFCPKSNDIDRDQLQGRYIQDQKITHFITCCTHSYRPLFFLRRSSSRSDSSSIAFSPAGVAAQPSPRTFASRFVAIDFLDG